MMGVCFMKITVQRAISRAIFDNSNCKLVCFTIYSTLCKYASLGVPRCNTIFRNTAITITWNHTRLPSNLLVAEFQGTVTSSCLPIGLKWVDLWDNGQINLAWLLRKHSCWITQMFRHSIYHRSFQLTWFEKCELSVPRIGLINIFSNLAPYWLVTVLAANLTPSLKILLSHRSNYGNKKLLLKENVPV